MHPIVKLAKETVEAYIKYGQIIKPPAELTAEMKERAGVFVSLKKNGELRGCIGTYTPATKNIATEVIQNAISASTQDPRFPPVSLAELDEIKYSVDVLSPPERVYDKRDLDPKRFGIVVKKGLRRGLLLPNLEGVDTVEEQLSIVRLKAGISPVEDIEIYRFKVRRYK